MRKPIPAVSTDACAQAIVDHCGEHMRIAEPLGLGKPNTVLNVMCRKTSANPKLSMDVCTALSLARPHPACGVGARFLGAFLQQHTGRQCRHSGGVVVTQATATGSAGSPRDVVAARSCWQWKVATGYTVAQMEASTPLALLDLLS